MPWYQVEMTADGCCVIAVDVPSEHCAAIESFMAQCEEQTRGFRVWEGGRWLLKGPFNTQEEALKAR